MEQVVYIWCNICGHKVTDNVLNHYNECSLESKLSPPHKQFTKARFLDAATKVQKIVEAE